MNDKLGRIWKEAVVAEVRYYPNIFQEGLRETSVETADIAAEIRTENIPNISIPVCSFRQM
jgi:hypothetical protein